MKFCFLVLHYKKIDLTIKCIQSILSLNIEPEDYIKIIIIDNFSNDGSKELLLKKYKNNPVFEFLLMDENLGFSEANNKGYNIAKSKFNPEFIIVINNDIIFNQIDFLNDVKKIFLESRCSILGPDIYCPINGMHQSPRSKTIQNLEETEKEIRNLFIKKSHLLERKWLILNYGKYFYKKFRVKINVHHRKKTYSEKSMNNVSLMGSCYILGRSFIESCDILFYPNIFMGGVEHCLFYRCMKAGHIMRYDCSIQVLHLHDYENFNSYKNYKDYNVFLLTEIIKSRKAYINLINTSEIKLKRGDKIN